MLCNYTTIAWSASVHKGVQENVQYGYKTTTTLGTVFNFLSAICDVAFSYVGHNVVLEIQATIPSFPQKPSKGPMLRGVIIAYLIVALCYFPVALIGYWMFGNTLYAIPVYDMIKTVMIKKLHFKPTRMLRLFAMSMLLPCIMWLAIFKPKKFSISWITNWVCSTPSSFFIII
ncbi:putative amino acid transporter, transmembrane domain-containing protein [Lupinus albus]|uniref:Putative amino acid transporter, transmembrane domain-containing protein n=1 Tax=Lupinus albus TaxID=3870 RepID=A0A6A4NQN0_LUPAL|nr:putative amino acid transporter, transmembrane domain-containing protein [Lupinus albus]